MNAQPKKVQGKVQPFTHLALSLLLLFAAATALAQPTTDIGTPPQRSAPAGSTTIGGNTRIGGNTVIGGSQGGFVPARPALPATIFVLIFDLNGNGIDLGGDAMTGLLLTQMTKMHWTKSSTDDGFLALDATSLRAAGYKVRNNFGVRMDGTVLLKSGITVTDPTGKDNVVTDGWKLLALFDSNKDGRINSADQIWSYLKLFVDANADGDIAPDELMTMQKCGVRDIILTNTSPAESDAQGNILSEGKYIGSDGAERIVADVLLRVLGKPQGSQPAAATTQVAGPR